jgi:LEA14-like dessication related protein
MKILIYSILILLTFSSCVEIQDVEFKGMDGVKVERMENKKLALKLGVKIENPNFFSIKVKPSVVDVFVNEELIGKAYLDESIKLIRKKEDTYFANVRIDLEDGALFKFVKYAMKLKVQLRVKGIVKGSALGIPKKVEINQLKEIDGSTFKIDNLLNLNK